MKSLFTLIAVALIQLLSCRSATSEISTHNPLQLNFDNEWSDWGELKSAWGLENASFQEERHSAQKILRVRYPKDSIDPGTMRRQFKPYGGLGFKKLTFTPAVSCAVLSYRLRFADDFEFVRGGKLPGLYGGTGNSGGKIPNGNDGFSTRFMWRSEGKGEVYAYLPTSIDYGTSIGKGNFHFARGVWSELKQEVRLNQPGKQDGKIRVWFNKKLVVDQDGLRFRDSPALGINGVFFETFFGGNDDSWRSLKDTHIDFADISISQCNTP